MLLTKLLIWVDKSVNRLTTLLQVSSTCGNKHTQTHTLNSPELSKMDLMLQKPHGEWWTKPQVCSLNNSFNNSTSGTTSKRDWKMLVKSSIRSLKPVNKSAVSSTKLHHTPWVPGKWHTQNHMPNTQVTLALDLMPQRTHGEWWTKQDQSWTTQECTSQTSTSTNNNCKNFLLVVHLKISLDCNNSDSGVMSRTSEDKLETSENKSPDISTTVLLKPPKSGNKLIQNHSTNMVTWLLIPLTQQLTSQTKCSISSSNWNNNNNNNSSSVVSRM